MDAAAENPAQAIDRLVDRYRSECLWFLREDYYPRSDADRARILGYIRRYGDREAWRAAVELERWLSRRSNESSSGS